MRILRVYIWPFITTLLLMLCINSSFASSPQKPSDVSSRYVIKGGEVYDKKTDLTWQRCNVGQNWKEGVGCVGIVMKMTFDEAQWIGSEPWRLPSKDELFSLIDDIRAEKHQKPAIDEVAFPGIDKSNLVFWSRTPFNNFNGWTVVFDDGYVEYSNRSNVFPIRLVRSGQ